MRSFYLWLAIGSLFVLGLSDSGRGPIFPDLLQTFGLSDTRGALYFFTTSLFGLLSNLASGWWLPRLGPYRALQLFLLIQGAALGLMGFAETYPVILIGAALFGVSLSGLGTTQNIIVAQTAEPRYSRRAFSLLHCMYGGASFLAPLMVSAVFVAGLRWQTTFFVFAVFPLSCLLISFLRNQYPKSAAPSAHSNDARFTPKEKRSVAWIAVLVTMYVFAELILSTRIVLYMRRELSYQPETANDALAAFFGLMLLGRMVFAFTPVHLPTLTLLRASAILSLVTFALGLFHHPYWLPLTGLWMAPFFPCLMALIQENFQAAKGEAVFARIFAAHAFGIMTMHIMTGWFSDIIGLRLALYLGPVALLIALAFLLFSSAVTRNQIDSPA